MLVLNVSGGGEFGVKTMNDKLVGMDINTDIIRARNEMLREVLTPPTFSIVEQSYKSTTFVSRLADGPELQAKLQAAMAEIDVRMKAILVAGLERGAKHHAASDPVRAKLNADKAAKLASGSFSMNATVGAATVPDGGDALTAKMEASRAALMARVEPSAEAGRDARTATYDEGAFVAMLGRAVDIARAHLGQTVTLDGVAVPAFRLNQGQVLPNLDVLRAFRKNRLDEKTHEPAAERPLLAAFKQYVDAVNSFDYYKHTTGDEHEDGGAVDQRKADARAMIAALRAGDAVDTAEVERLLHTNAGGVEVAQQDTASEAEWFNATRHHGDRIVLNLDVKDLGLRVMEAQARTMNQVVGQELRGEALQDAALRTDDDVIAEKRAALADVRVVYLRALEVAIAEQTNDQARAALEAERSVPLLMGGDEFSLSVHPLLASQLPTLVASLAQVTNSRITVVEARSTRPDSERANQSAHRDAMQAGESGHDRLKNKIEVEVQRLRLRATRFPDNERAQAEALIGASGLTTLYSTVDVTDGATTVVLRDFNTGDIVTDEVVTQRIAHVRAALDALESR